MQGHPPNHRIAVPQAVIKCAVPPRDSDPSQMLSFHPNPGAGIMEWFRLEQTLKSFGSNPPSPWAVTFPCNFGTFLLYHALPEYHIKLFQGRSVLQKR